MRSPTWSQQQARDSFVRLLKPLDPVPVSFSPSSPHLWVLFSPMLVSGHRNFLWILASAFETLTYAVPLPGMLFFLLCVRLLPMHPPALSWSVASFREAFSDAWSRIMLLLCSTRYSAPTITFGMLHSNSYAHLQVHLTPQPPSSLAFMLPEDRNPIYLSPHCIPDTQPNAQTY